MQLPSYLTEKINNLFSSSKNLNLKMTRENLTDKYKNKTGKSESLIGGKGDSVTYAVTRMPATYSVIYSLFFELLSEGLLENVKTISDVGSGTGAGYFAISQLASEYSLDDAGFNFSSENYNLYETSSDMINVFNLLSDDKKISERKNILTAEIDRSDLIFSCYMLSELSVADREKAFEKMLSNSDRYVLVIDTGTPETYKSTYALKTLAEKAGFSVTAPCKSNKCTLENDYCQFYARVERSALLRQSKSAVLPYEDEKYFYMLFEKTENLNKNLSSSETARVIRRPVIKEKQVSLVLCTDGGVTEKKVTKAEKEQFKKAKKVKINQLF